MVGYRGNDEYYEQRQKGWEAAITTACFIFIGIIVIAAKSPHWFKLLMQLFHHN